MVFQFCQSPLSSVLGVESRLQSVKEQTGGGKWIWAGIVLCSLCEGKEKNRDGRVLFVGFKNEHWGVRGSSQTRERKKPCSKSWLNTTAFTKCFHAAGQSEKRVSHKDTPTEAILHSPVSVCHRGHSSLCTLLRHCDFFQAEN